MGPARLLATMQKQFHGHLTVSVIMSMQQPESLVLTATDTTLNSHAAACQRYRGTKCSCGTQQGMVKGKVQIAQRHHGSKMTRLSTKPPIWQCTEAQALSPIGEQTGRNK